MVTLVATKGTGSMDLYRQKLCQHLNTCSIHLSFPEPFGTPLLSAQAVKFLIHSYETLKALSQYKRPDRFVAGLATPNRNLIGLLLYPVIFL